ILLLVVVLVLGALAGRESATGPTVLRTESMMDTLITIKAWGPEEVSKVAVDRGFEVFRRLDRLASFHREDSELSQFNRHRTLAATASLSVLLDIAARSYQQTTGVFDPTFAVLHRAYGFYDQRGRIPSEQQLNEILAFVGWDKMVSRRDDGWHLASGALVDLGGVAGGYAVDQAAAIMRESGCTAFLIDDAGDLWMEGTKPGSEPWKIMVRDPRGEQALAFVESAVPVAISTSGDYERFVEVDGRRICHIFVPSTGKSADWYRSVTVVASSSLAADTLSTTLFAMPPGQAREWAEAHGVAALFLPATGSTWLSAAGTAWFTHVVP
ncbi:MAG TPA: FAD:protein FMN transferase, partial [Candidatus Ozemobacteraceae bacterium]|nr:FAD:protein FMN transferase [Candidatus Ozemobacteraceae bacterium]